MIDLYLAPNWFLGYDICLELVFAIITLLVCFYGFKIYKLSEQRESKLFGLSFLFISAAYFVQSFVNFSMISKLKGDIDAGLLDYIGFNTHIILFMIGLITFAYMTFKVKNGKIYSLFLILMLVSVLLSENVLYTFYLLSSVLLMYIIVYYFSSYLKKKQPGILFTLIAFALLLFARIHFIISINYSLYYAIGHLLELIAYIIILVNLILVIKK